MNESVVLVVFINSFVNLYGFVVCHGKDSMCSPTLDCQMFIVLTCKILKAGPRQICFMVFPFHFPTSLAHGGGKCPTPKNLSQHGGTDSLTLGPGATVCTRKAKTTVQGVGAKLQLFFTLHFRSKSGFKRRRVAPVGTRWVECNEPN